MNNEIAIIGDVHGDMHGYFRTVLNARCHRTIQVGDMGFDYGQLAHIPCSQHRFFGGNHDNYDTYYDCPHSLGDYGPLPFLPNSFFVRGAYSIDYPSLMAKERTENTKLWWHQEELSLPSCIHALNEYQWRKPKIMLSHDCPLDVSRMIGDPQILRNYGRDPNTFMTRTQCLLDTMLDEHKPDVWLFGHYHKDVQVEYKGTKFYCIPPLSFLKITPDGEVLF